MRRSLVLALTALALLGAVASDALAQAPAPAAPVPTFKITGFIDELITYSKNVSVYDGDLNRIDRTFYGRTRGRFDIIGEYGKAKAVLGLELDFAYGQTGTGNSNMTNVQGGAPTQSAGAVFAPFGTDGSFSINTDVRGILEIKWLYTEFEAPYIPWPTIVRLGAQPFGAAATYKLAAYANGDFAGVNIVTTATPNVKLVASFVSVEENMVGREQISGTNLKSASNFCALGFGANNANVGNCPVFGVNYAGVNPFQLRGDDWAIILAPEITPIKGLDIKPMFSYATFSGTTTGNARQGRGGINATTWFQNTCFGGTPAGTVNPNTGLPVPAVPAGPAGQNGPDCTGNNANGTWRKGLNEDRLTVGLDGRYRMGPFSLDPTIMYQFGNVSRLAPTLASGQFPQSFLDAGVVPGRKYTADIKAWLIDVRGGYQIGPLLLEAMFMWSSGNSARNTTLNTTRYYQPLTTDTSYLADWGGQLTALGIDYLNALNEAGVYLAYPGVSIGWDKYGRYQIGARATYAWTPALSMYGGVNANWTAQDIQENAGLCPTTTPQTVCAGGNGLIPLWTGQQANLKSQYVGTEIFAGLTWRFAPGIALDSAGGYMWMGPASNAFTNPQQGARDAHNAYILTSRIRVSF